ncbi:MAG: hypothetical protein WKF42_07235 [Solirubrobacteraceae bacterium]
MSKVPPSAALDLRALLATLDRHAVEYTVIGGVAVQSTAIGARRRIDVIARRTIVTSSA